MNIRLTCAAIAFSVGTLSAASPKYVFLFIGDGMATPQRMIADEFSRATGRGPLAMNSLPFQATTRTCSANALVTDSAAAATAIACGTPTNNGSTGVDATGRPVESCATVAKKAGHKVGIVTTVTINHATPSAFYAHRKSRGDGYGISLDLVNSGFDFFAGGGLAKYNDAAHPEYVGDIYEHAAKNGYRVVTTREEFLSLRPTDGKVLTHFCDGAFDDAIDIRDAKEPSLVEIVTKAVEMLDNEKGFFLMAEGGRVDWSAHANDAATNVREVMELDAAVKVALAFQEKHPDETLIIVTGDHETGGLGMGFEGTGYKIYPDRLAAQKISAGKFNSEVAKLFEKRPDLSFDDVCPFIRESFGFRFPQSSEGQVEITPQDVESLRKAFDHDVALYRAKVEENSKYDGVKRYLLGGACRLLISHKSGYGWTSSAHTAMPTLTTAKGPGAELFSGFLDHAGVGSRIKSLY